MDVVKIFGQIVLKQAVLKELPSTFLPQQHGRILYGSASKVARLARHLIALPSRFTETCLLLWIGDDSVAYSVSCDFIRKLQRATFCELYSRLQMFVKFGGRRIREGLSQVVPWFGCAYTRA
jgi:hypothetical protein